MTENEMLDKIASTKSTFNAERITFLFESIEEIGTNYNMGLFTPTQVADQIHDLSKHVKMQVLPYKETISLERLKIEEKC